MNRQIQVNIRADTSKLEQALRDGEAMLRYPTLHRYSPKAARVALEFEQATERVNEIFRKNPA